MPVISVFLGMVIRMYHADHNPPHIHVQYGEYEAVLGVVSGKILAGDLPPKVRRLVKEWILLRKRELLKAWKQAQGHKNPSRVKPLD
jgi:hypothetical protein